jgi:glycine hydroxymethyltransferase
MFLVDLRSIDEDLTGKQAARTLDNAGVTLNMNDIPFDPRKPFIASGVRIGTPSVTTAGMREPEMERLGKLIVGVLRSNADEVAVKQLSVQIADLAAEFPGYPEDFPGHV